jgi:hypothetical protein
MTKIAGSGSISQRHGSADPDPDPDPPQNVTDPQHWILEPDLFMLHIPVSTTLPKRIGLTGPKFTTRNFL